VGESLATAVTRRRDASRVYVTVGKRATDIAVGLVLTAVALPIIAVLAIVSAISLRAWPFFVQDRVGRDGRGFRFPKIRTLPKTAAASADKREIARISIPRWCELLRSTHLDELPQLFCVLSGTMSLVGPRPEMPRMLERYPRAFAVTRASVRPGCTGLWQVSVDNGGMIYEAPQYDEYYVDHSSLALDLWILARTLLSSMSSRYRTTLASIPKWAGGPGPSAPAPASVAPRVESTRTAEPAAPRADHRYDIDLTTVESPTLVAGAGGFIGGHLVQHLLRAGVAVRAVDIKPFEDWYQLDERAQNDVMDLHDASAAKAAVEGVGTIYNFAADMGGMGFIENNKALCMLSVLTNTHLLMAARESDVERYFFSSSACVYAADKQVSADVVALAENDAYPAMPEDGYGWEKLFSERMCRHFREDFGLETRIARYHNVYGPYGTFAGGREKAPAAICRKVIEAVRSGVHEIEIWGDGEQTRSFMYVDDCITGTEMILSSDFVEPINLGSSQLVTINELVDIAEDIAGVKLRRRYVLDAPLGVRGRNSDNTLIQQEFGWEPSIRLEDGLEQTYRWIYDRVAESLYVGA